MTILCIMINVINVNSSVNITLSGVGLAKVPQLQIKQQPSN